MPPLPSEKDILPSDGIEPKLKIPSKYFKSGCYPLIGGTEALIMILPLPWNLSD